MTARDRAMVALLAIDAGRLEPADDGDLVARVAGLPPLPLDRAAFDRLEDTRLIRVTGDDRAELTGRGRGQINAWLAARGRVVARQLDKGAV